MSRRDRLRLRMHISLLSGASASLSKSISHSSPSAVREAQSHIGPHWYVVSAAHDPGFPPCSGTRSLPSPTANGTSVCFLNLIPLLPSASSTPLTDGDYDICPVAAGHPTHPSAGSQFTGFLLFYTPSTRMCSCRSRFSQSPYTPAMRMVDIRSHLSLPVHRGCARACMRKHRAHCGHALTYCVVAVWQAHDGLLGRMAARKAVRTTHLKHTTVAPREVGSHHVGECGMPVYLFQSCVTGFGHHELLRSQLLMLDSRVLSVSPFSSVQGVPGTRNGAGTASRLSP
ncbi:hypothetical protein C8Q77DRAFT_83821 [Trametes polyzona]|nr:hypothetical protein C8Q77DRAFT_83821 [Trametes polyzona]